MLSAALEPKKGALQALDDGPALMGANSFAQSGAGSLFPQSGFNPVEVLDLPHHPTCRFGRLFQGLMELSSHMRPAAGQFNGSVAPVGKRTVGGVAVALHGPFEVNRNDVAQALRRPAGFPAIKHIAPRPTARPQITLLGRSMTGCQ